MKTISRNGGVGRQKQQDRQCRELAKQLVHDAYNIAQQSLTNPIICRLLNEVKQPAQQGQTRNVLNRRSWFVRPTHFGFWALLTKKRTQTGVVCCVQKNGHTRAVSGHTRAVSGHTRAHLGTFGHIRAHSDTLGHIWTQFRFTGHARAHLDTKHRALGIPGTNSDFER